MSDDQKKQAGPTWRMRWIIHPKVRNTFLALSGVALFFLGSLVLKTRQERVDFDLRIYRWPSKLNAGSSPFRAQAVHTSSKTPAHIGLCATESVKVSGAAPVPKGARGVETVLDLLGSANERGYEVCLTVDGWGKRTFAVQRPPTRRAQELHSYWGWFEAQSVSYVAHDGFPFDVLAVPDGGSYNPKKEHQNLLLLLRARDPSAPPVRVQTSLGVYERGPGGMFEIPLKKTPLGAVVVLTVIDNEGQRYATTLRFSMSARDFEVRAKRSGQELTLSITSLLSSNVEDDGSAIPVFCSVFMGDAVLATRQGWLPSPEAPGVMTFTLSEEVASEIVAVGCDTSPFYSALDSASTWVFPERGVAVAPEWTMTISQGLLERVGSKQAAALELDLGSKDLAVRQRTRRLMNQILPPQPPGMEFVVGSYVDDQLALLKKYRLRRLALMVTLVVVLLTWLYMMLYALKINRLERINALDFLSHEDSGGLDESARTALFSRPNSGLLATSVVLVMILSMVGLIWVLFWL